MQPKTKSTRPGRRPEIARTRPEILLADIVLALGRQERDQIRTFVHLAEEPGLIKVSVDASRETGLRLVLTYPVSERP